MVALAEVKSVVENNKWGVQVLSRETSVAQDPSPARIDYSALPFVKTNERALNGYKSPNQSIFVEKVEHRTKDTQNLKKNFRKGAAAGSVLINALAAGSLFYGASKLLTPGSDVDSSYKTIGRGFAIGGLAGAVTGVAQESNAWSLGNIGMGVAGVLGLDSKYGLALHTVSDGLASQGMSAVRFREQENAMAVTRSIFNNPVLKPLNFLQPTEQSIYSFFHSVKSKQGLKSFLQDEPYALFKRSAGGLISAGGLLAAGSMFKGRIADVFNTIKFLPYAALSMVNVVAFGRDAQMILKRVKAFSSDTEGEHVSLHGEGYAKLAATPFLALNNIALAFKGLGLEINEGFLFNSAMAFRSIGAALGMIGFACQAGMKFFNPALFGSDGEEHWTVRVDPGKCLDNTFAAIDYGKALPQNGDHAHRTEMNKQLKEILMNNDKCGSCVSEIIDMDVFKGLQGVTMIGLPNFSHNNAHQTVILNRYDHCIGVGGTSVIAIKEAIEQAQDESVKTDLERNETAFIIANTIHDLYHVSRSHVLEKVIPGHKDEELLLWKLLDENSDISKVIIKHHGKETLKQIMEIIGRKNKLLYKLHKNCDRMHYQGIDEYPLLKNPRLKFFKAGLDDITERASMMRPFKNPKGEYDLAYTEVGAVQELMSEYARYMYFTTEHGPWNRIESDIPYSVAIMASKGIPWEDLKTMNEGEVDNVAKQNSKNISRSDVTIKINSGGRWYVGYDKNNRNRRILVMDSNTGKVREISEWIETTVKGQDQELYDKLMHVLNTLSHTRTVYLHALLENGINAEDAAEGAQSSTPAELIEDAHNKSEHAGYPHWAMTG